MFLESCCAYTLQVDFKQKMPSNFPIRSFRLKRGVVGCGVEYGIWIIYFWTHISYIYGGQPCHRSCKRETIFLFYPNFCTNSCFVAWNQVQRSSWLLPIVNHGVDMDDEVLPGLLRLLVRWPNLPHLPGKLLRRAQIWRFEILPVEIIWISE